MANSKFFWSLSIILILFSIVILYKHKIDTNRRTEAGVENLSKKLRSFKYWKIFEESGNEVTFVDCSDGIYILDNCNINMNNEGIMVVFEKNTRRCFSFVRKSANVYDRKTLSLIEKNKCIRGPGVIKSDFSKQYPTTISTSRDFKNLKDIVDFLKNSGIIQK